MIDPNKQYRTRDGREVRIYAVDGGGNKTFHGAIQHEWGWGAAQWFPNGNYLDALGDPRDLIEVKPRIKRKVWLNVYPESSGIPDALYYGRASADNCASSRRIACVEIDIDVEEGHGLT